MLREHVAAGILVGADDRRAVARRSGAVDDYRRQLPVGLAAVAKIGVACAQRVAPSRECRVELSHDRMGAVDVGVLRAREVEVLRRVGAVVLVGMQHVVSERHAVRRIDIPIQTGYQCARERRHVVSGITAAVPARERRVVRAYGRGLLCRDGAARGRRVVCRRYDVAVVFAVDEEEEFVAHDRSRERQSVYLRGLLRELRALGDARSGRRTVEILVVIVEVCRAAQAVVARLRDGIDAAAREAALAHVERRHGYPQLLYGIERYGVGLRKRAGHARGAQTVYVVAGHAVDAERVVSRAGTCDTHAARLGRYHLRREPRDVVYRTCYGRHRGYALRAEPLARAVTADRRIVGHDHNAVDVERLRSELDVDALRIAQQQLDVLDTRLVVTQIAYRKRIGTTHAHTRNIVLSVGIGRNSVLRTRRSMNGYYRRSDHRIGLRVLDTTRH